MAQIFSILLFITYVYYLGRIPSPILTKKLKEALEIEERLESEEERDVEIEIASEMKGTKQEQERSTEEDPYPSPSLFSKDGWDPAKIDEKEEVRVNTTNKIKDKFHSHLTETGHNNINTSNSPIYDYQDSYLNNNNTGNLENCKVQRKIINLSKSDGKQRISFTYLPVYQLFGNDKKKDTPIVTPKNNKEFLNRLEILDKESLSLDILETRTRFCNDDTKKEYFTIFLPNIDYKNLNKKRIRLIKNHYQQKLTNS
uniref:Protein TIC 214 n=1 Tax=Solanum lycopersicum TaxID=4081 RepID=A0A3Q7IX67_SOLLC